jgi:hypothetical protein
MELKLLVDTCIVDTGVHSKRATRHFAHKTLCNYTESLLTTLGYTDFHFAGHTYEDWNHGDHKPYRDRFLYLGFYGVPVKNEIALVYVAGEINGSDYENCSNSLRVYVYITTPFSTQFSSAKIVVDEILQSLDVVHREQDFFTVHLRPEDFLEIRYDENAYISMIVVYLVGYGARVPMVSFYMFLSLMIMSTPIA